MTTAALQDVTNQILQILEAADRPLTVREVLSELKAEPEDEAPRRAIWDLIYDRKLTLTPERTLRLQDH